MRRKHKKPRLHIKVGDIVKVIAGDYKGQTGEVIKIIYNNKKVIVKDINMTTKHLRPQQEGETGSIIRQEKPIDSSNIMLYDTKNATASRYKKVRKNDGQYERILLKITEQ
uniref:Large ribosomal subunit protein uL24c n=1 Tax=Yamadaella caenomyce TaxID=259029 RepID=A0A1G4NYX5_9FLOR|nr:Ribosomal protein L24 [Yamadaella caenomyce]SCW23847.1 Ribosomal protein L24 [Yamadaella caenomyce]